ncbi:MAG: hypothetical protein VX453_00370 [Acidobacteriota bacterium]|nr:hypothetical protein [Acidobacteriota bacterium]
MSVEGRHDARLAQAQQEAGRTDITPSVARMLVGVFLTVIVAVPVSQILLEYDVLHSGLISTVTTLTTTERPQTTATIGALILALNRRLLGTIHELTDRLDNDSLLAHYLRPNVQYLLTRWVGTGNEHVLIGRTGWLYYRQDIEHVIGPGFLDPGQLAKRTASGDSLNDPPTPDPRPALNQFHTALARRGISLILLPTPVKPTIHPEHLELETTQTPIQNVSFSRFITEMRNDGLMVFDPAPLLVSLRNRGEPTYLATDTHWRPNAVVAVAGALAAFIDREVPLHREKPFFTERRMTPVTNQGDTVALLNLTNEPLPDMSETVILPQVITSDGQSWRVDTRSDVLLMGDSFANIYSLPSMGWGDGAGLAEQVSAALGRRLDRTVQNDNGAFATREALAREIQRGRDPLVGKRLVIYQFTTRELTHGDWRLVDFAPQPATIAQTVLTPIVGQRLTVRGRIRQRAPAPRPSSVPYRDHIIAIDLDEIISTGAQIDETEALVYLSSMEDNIWTEAATLDIGQTVTLTLRPWSEVTAERGGVTRSELVDGNVLYAEPWWGELTTP